MPRPPVNLNVGLGEQFAVSNSTVDTFTRGVADQNAGRGLAQLASAFQNFQGNAQSFALQQAQIEGRKVDEEDARVIKQAQHAAGNLTSSDLKRNVKELQDEGVLERHENPLYLATVEEVRAQATINDAQTAAWEAYTASAISGDPNATPSEINDFMRAELDKFHGDQDSPHYSQTFQDLAPRALANLSKQAGSHGGNLKQRAFVKDLTDVSRLYVERGDIAGLHAKFEEKYEEGSILREQANEIAIAVIRENAIEAGDIDLFEQQASQFSTGGGNLFGIASKRPGFMDQLKAAVFETRNDKTLADEDLMATLAASIQSGDYNTQFAADAVNNGYITSKEFERLETAHRTHNDAAGRAAIDKQIKRNWEVQDQVALSQARTDLLTLTGPAEDRTFKGIPASSVVEVNAVDETLTRERDPQVAYQQAFESLAADFIEVARTPPEPGLESLHAQRQKQALDKLATVAVGAGLESKQLKDFFSQGAQSANPETIADPQSPARLAVDLAFQMDRPGRNALLDHLEGNDRLLYDLGIKGREGGLAPAEALNNALVQSNPDTRTVESFTPSAEAVASTLEGFIRKSPAGQVFGSLDNIVDTGSNIAQALDSVLPDRLVRLSSTSERTALNTPHLLNGVSRRAGVYLSTGAYTESQAINKAWQDYRQNTGTFNSARVELDHWGWSDTSEAGKDLLSRYGEHWFNEKAKQYNVPASELYLRQDGAGLVTLKRIDSDDILSDLGEPDQERAFDGKGFRRRALEWDKVHQTKLREKARRDRYDRREFISNSFNAFDDI